MTNVITPLRQRMIDDMRMRKLVPKTQSAYLLHVPRLAAFLGRPPDTATGEDARICPRCSCTWSNKVLRRAP